MSIILPGCQFGFYAFNANGPQTASAQKYRTARLDDHDFCNPNGFLTLEFGLTPCGAVITESTGDYANFNPVGSIYGTEGFLQLQNVDNPTFSWFYSTCPDPKNPTTPIKISWTLSNPI